jgi:hypothetical protein
MTSIEKTEALERKSVLVDLIDPTPGNPNEMTDAEFNMLADNIEKVGFVDPVFLRPLPNGRYRMIGGNHRLEVAKVLGYTEIPATIITDPEFDEDQEKFQVVRMNVIKGHLSPAKFMKLYGSLQGKYAEDIMAESFGFAEREQFQKLIGQMAAALPQEVQKDFKEAAKELKTIDGLSKLLNGMFTKYGDTLPYGYMCVEFGGKDSIWLRLDAKTHKAALTMGKMCVDEHRTMDDLLGGLIRLAADGKLGEQLVQLIAQAPEVGIPANTFPTYEDVAAA